MRIIYSVNIIIQQVLLKLNVISKIFGEFIALEALFYSYIK